MNQNMRTFYKNFGLGAFGMGANAAEVDVKDGKIVRIRPMRFDRAYDMEKECNPWTIKARGSEFKAIPKSLLPPHSLVYKKRTYSPNRILYPLKREDWDPNGKRNPQNRGKSKFVRISWDEATDLIAAEIKRVIKQYGPYSILAQCDGHGESGSIHASHGCMTHLLKLLGGYTCQARQPDSWEGWYWGARHVWGIEPHGQGLTGNLLKDMAQNSEMILFWGADIETTSWGWGGQFNSKYCFWLSEIGVKQIYICPDVNYGCAVHADKWIPVLPNTDSALQLAIIYTWLQEDLWDKEYVRTHAVGYETFFDYVLGKSDDYVPKTPKWAEAICGVPSRTIKALARKWHKNATSIAHCNGGSYIRSCYSHEPARLEAICLAMQGLGKPGRNQMKFIEWMGVGNKQPAPAPEFIPNVSGCYRGYLKIEEPSFIPKTLIPEAILGNYTEDNPLTWYSYPVVGWPVDFQFVEYQYPIPGAQPVHLIWTDTPCWTTCWNGGNKMIEALRSEKIECIIAQHPWMENDCLFADIILPIDTKLEEEDIAVDASNGSYWLLLYEGKCIPSRGESMSDYEAVGEIAKKLGLYEQYTQGRTIEEWIRKGFEESGVAAKISYEEFRQKGYYVVPTRANWEENPAGFELFCKDPENNPLPTPTGKIEFYSTNLAEYFPDDEERKPYPRYIPYGKTHQESLQHPRSEKYPFLIVSNHPRWRVHAQLDDIPWLREIPTCKVTGPDGYQYEPVWINPKDAAKLGVGDGDVVKIYNDRGWVLGGVYVTERIMPGVVYQDHGARLDPIVLGESDRGGANNLICPSATTSSNCPGEVTSGYLVAVEPVDVHELSKKYPEAFNRVYDKGIGVSFRNWIKEEEK